MKKVFRFMYFSAICCFLISSYGCFKEPVWPSRIKEHNDLLKIISVKRTGQRTVAVKFEVNRSPLDPNTKAFICWTAAGRLPETKDHELPVTMASQEVLIFDTGPGSTLTFRAAWYNGDVSYSPEMTIDMPTDIKIAKVIKRESNYDNLLQVVPLKDGDLMLVTTRNLGVRTQTQVVRMNADFQVKWEANLPPQLPVGKAILAPTGKGFLLAEHSNAIGIEQAITVSKIDMEGNVLWNRMSTYSKLSNLYALEPHQGDSFTLLSGYRYTSDPENEYEEPFSQTSRKVLDRLGRWQSETELLTETGMIHWPFVATITDSSNMLYLFNRRGDGNRKLEAQIIGKTKPTWSAEMQLQTPIIGPRAMCKTKENIWAVVSEIPHILKSSGFTITFLKYQEGWDAIEKSYYLSPYAQWGAALSPTYISTDGSGNLYVSASAYEDNSKMAYVAKLDKKGDIQWDLLLPEINTTAKAVLPLPGGQVLVISNGPGQILATWLQE